MEYLTFVLGMIAGWLVNVAVSAWFQYQSEYRKKSRNIIEWALYVVEKLHQAEAQKRGLLRSPLFKEVRK